MKNKQKKSKTIGIGFFFIISIIFIVAISFIFKAIDIFEGSKFDGESTFNILEKENNGWQAFSISPQNNSIHFVKISKDTDTRELGIPYDIYFENSKDIVKKDVKSRISSILVDSRSNPFDILKLTIFLNSVSSDSIKSTNIDSKTQDPKIITNIFFDPIISSENLNIEIVNATGESGVGSYFAKVVTNMGGKVVLVSTDSDIVDKSSIVTLDFDSQIAHKVSKMFNIKIYEEKAGVSDLRLIIGKDLLSKIR